MAKERLEYVSANLYRDRNSKIYYGLRRLNGRKILHSLQVTDHKTALGKLHNWLGEFARRDPRASTMKMDALVDKWLAIRPRDKEKTRANDESRAKVFRATFKQGMAAPVASIRTSDLATWMRDTGNTRGWQSSAFNQYRMFLKDLFKLAVADKVILKADNPYDPEFIPCKPKNDTLRPIPTTAQFEAILAAIEQDAHRPKQAKQSRQFTALLGCCGVGQAEANTMRVKDLGTPFPNPVDERLHFIRQKTKDRPKGGDFTQPIFAEARALIDELRDAHRLSMPETPVFTILNADAALASAVAGLGLPHFTPRNLRAMWVKRRYDEGWSPKQISKWQGHRDGGVLIQTIYTEVFCESDDATLRAKLSALEPMRVVA